LERTSGLFASGFNGTTDSGGEEEEEDRPLSFGEKLRAGRDEDEEAASDEEKGKFALEEQHSTRRLDLSSSMGTDLMFYSHHW
jgi:Ran-binding protein 3